MNHDLTPRILRATRLDVGGLISVLGLFTLAGLTMFFPIVGHANKEFVWPSALIFVLGCYGFYKLMRSRQMAFQAFPDHLLVYFKKEVIEKIPYHEIHSLHCKTFMDGLYKFELRLKSGRKVQIPAMLERKEYVLEAIYRLRPDLFIENSYDRLYRILVINEHALYRLELSWGNKKQIAKSLLHLTLIFFGSISFVTVFGSLLDHYFHPYKDWHDFALSIFYGHLYVVQLSMLGLILSWFFAKRYWLVHAFENIKAQPESKIFNSGLEQESRRVFYKALLIGLFSALFLYTFDTDNRKISIYYLGQETVPHYMDFYKNHKVPLVHALIDRRFYCVDCAYSLERGDLIMLRLPEETQGREKNRAQSEKHTVAKVIALPDERVSAELVPEMMRGPAQESRPNAGEYVPEDKILVFNHETDAFEYQELDSIFGKILDAKYRRPKPKRRK